MKKKIKDLIMHYEITIKKLQVEMEETSSQLGYTARDAQVMVLKDVISDLERLL